MSEYARISDLLRDLVFERTLDLTTAADKYLTDDFRMGRDGGELNRADFIALAAVARARMAGATLTVIDELRDGDNYAERHLNDVRWADGSRTHEQVFIFGTYAPDGRFATLHESAAAVPDGSDGQER